MRLSKREQRMLLFLGMLAIVGVYYQFVLQPQLNRIKEATAKEEQYKNKVRTVKMQISPKNPLHEEFKVLNADIAGTTQRYFPFIKQEKIITILNDMLDKTNVESLSLGFSEAEINGIKIEQKKAKNKDFTLKKLTRDFRGEVQGDTQIKDDAQVQDQQESTKKDDSESMEKMSITLNYKGSYDNIIKFIKELEGFHKKILIQNISATKEEDGSLTGNIILDFYGLPKLEDQDAEYLEWNFNNKYGRENPFEDFEGYVSIKDSSNEQSGVQSAENQKENVDVMDALSKTSFSKIKMDFVMTVKAVSSDWPTMMLGYGKDTTTKTYIYADNLKPENVEVQILQEGKKYYYRYRSQFQKYPRNYESEKATFTPSGDTIFFRIVSSQRSGNEDESGVNLSIRNKTDLKMKVIVQGDDADNPRIKIVAQTGKIEVQK